MLLALEVLTFLLTVALVLADAATPRDTDIKVTIGPLSAPSGSWSNGLTLDLKPAPDARVAFFFNVSSPSQHSIVQTSLDKPCVAVPLAFSTGVNMTNNGTILVLLPTDTQPLYLACAQHCHDGEVGMINAPPNEPDALQVFITAAKASTETDWTLGTASTIPVEYTPGNVYEESITFNGGVTLIPSALDAPETAEKRKETPTWALALLCIFVPVGCGVVFWIARRTCLRTRRAETLARRSRWRTTNQTLAVESFAGERALSGDMISLADRKANTLV
ncbi:hypothetical protein EXIGLDRAFT_760076 [Exidia glandulosa HHB12029]|uniref:Cupredoxin n=1 Tax=Exidia glandulosa HHB12029 TaxID=1314781 RepID=A0A165PIU6_EXIGL|nr:hypothetical protein EXIGLDRAFT_760076 [Exidia glandulosa HHB12029]